ncbi:ABC-2 transporter permease [Actinoplanes subtropicus]|uniref:ABC-2 transporter permease n=1 Tax=Actinoplanes subtropicus TaxID=543632 RepID=UPI00068CAF50|nr:ABC-2 transporter permease [Actinoplanes subtropicus]
MIRAEWTKFRSVRAWVAGIVVAFAAILGLGVAGAYGISQDCMGRICPAPPTGPGGEAVRDKFSYVHQTLDGDGELTAHLAGFTGIITYPPPNHDAIVAGLVPWAKAGLMIKDGTKVGAAYAAVMMTGHNGVRMQNNFTEDRAGPSAASWLRISRQGDKIIGYASSDGAAWTPIETVVLKNIHKSVNIGFFVTSPSDITNEASPRGGTIVQARFTQATAVFDRIDRTGAWSLTKVGDTGEQTDWQKYHTPDGYTESNGRLTVTGSGDIAPAGNEGGPTIDFALTGVIVALIAVIIVGALYITGEFRRGLIRTTYAAMPARGRVLAAKAAVLGAVTFVPALLATAIAVPVASRVLRSHHVTLLPAAVGTQVRVIVGAALLLSLAAIFAYALGAALKRGVIAIALAVVLVVLPYLLATTSLLPPGAGRWLLRLTPAAGFAFQQVLPAYHQISLPYTPSDGYYPLGPWAGLGVLAAWAAALLGLAILRARRSDA